MDHEGKQIALPPKIKPHVRWMIRTDMESVLEIEQAEFQYPWTEDEFIRCLRQRSCIGAYAFIYWLEEKAGEKVA